MTTLPIGAVPGPGHPFVLWGHQLVPTNGGAPFLHHLATDPRHARLYSATEPLWRAEAHVRRPEDPPSDVWAYWNTAAQRLSLIYTSRVLFNVCFPHDPEGTAAHRGDAVLNLVITAAAPASPDYPVR